MSAAGSPPTGSLKDTLKRLGHDLPAAATAIAAYKPFLRRDNLLFISGQLPMRDGKSAYNGILHNEGDLPRGVAAAELAALNLLAQLDAALGGDLNQLGQCLRLGGYVAAADGFTAHSKVIDGASALLRSALAEKGGHARAAVGVSSLPLGATVELEGLFALV